MEFSFGEVVYTNPLSCQDDISDFLVEGNACITFPMGRMRLESGDRDDEHPHKHGNYLIWLDGEFDDGTAVSWDFRPLTDKGLAMVWMAAKGRNGEDIRDPSLAPRDGDYTQYHHGDINALHASYYRRNPGEISFRTCNLRKSYGFHLVCQGADPLPDARYVEKPYRIEALKAGPHFRLSINHLVIFHFVDDGSTYGPPLREGAVGFRQMKGLIAEYSNLRIRRVSEA